MKADPPTQAPEGHSEAVRAPQRTLVMHPDTGELIDRLEAEPPELLADLYVAIREHQARLEAMRKLVKGELQNRLDMRGVAKMVVGDYEIGESHGTRSRWDGEALETVVRELIDNGAISYADVRDLIRHDTVVNGNVANALSRRLAGANKRAVEDCRTREPDRRAFDVVRSLPLVAGEGEQ